MLRFAATPAGTGIVSRGGREDVGDLVGESTLPQETGHEVHGSVDVGEEIEVTGAEVVESGIAVGSEREPVLWALAVAREAHGAVEAVLGQRVELGLTELTLLRPATSDASSSDSASGCDGGRHYRGLRYWRWAR